MLHKIIYNTLASYILKAVQLILSLAFIPIFISELGQEGFGLITFANVLIGYFFIFDLGITTGVTKYVSQFLAEKKIKKVSQVINTTIFLFSVLVQ